jgi:hypothetical protein
MTDTTSVTTSEDTTFQLLPTTGEDSALSVVEVNLGGAPLQMERLTRVTIPGGGGRQWIVRTLRGEERHDELIGIIVHTQTSRSFYRETYSGGGSPPDCSSNDGITGTPGYEGHTSCLSCPMNAWGSANGASNAKKCNEYAQIYLLQHSKALPIVVRVSPGSLGALSDFMQQLSGELLRRDRVVIGISLADGGGYSRASFRLVRELDADEAKEARSYVEHFGRLVRGTPATDIVVDQVIETPYDDTPMPTIAPDDLPFE